MPQGEREAGQNGRRPSEREGGRRTAGIAGFALVAASVAVRCVLCAFPEEWCSPYFLLWGIASGFFSLLGLLLTLGAERGRWTRTGAVLLLGLEICTACIWSCCLPKPSIHVPGRLEFVFMGYLPWLLPIWPASWFVGRTGSGRVSWGWWLLLAPLLWTVAAALLALARALVRG